MSPVSYGLPKELVAGLSSSVSPPPELMEGPPRPTYRRAYLTIPPLGGNSGQIPQSETARNFHYPSTSVIGLESLSD